MKNTKGIMGLKRYSHMLVLELCVLHSPKQENASLFSQVKKMMYYKMKKK